ncbi:MAG: hypothetical protein Q8R67_01965 [Rhodoferax sp.]|nr:hypothetical protein [Rhodoferax sp.]MDP3650426.1 hypothetical protein [Rhodoferax sp.]
MKKVLAGLLVCGACVLAHAEGSNWRFFAAAGMSNGGDTIASGTITTVGSGSVVPFEIKPGTGTQFRVGADYRLSEGLTLQGSIGRAVSDPMGMNGSMEFTTTPVEFLGFVNLTEAFRLGGGLRKTYARMTASGISAGWSGVGDYSSTLGTVLEAQYLFSASEGKSSTAKPQLGLSVRWVNESFSHDGANFSGRHYEVGVAFYY